MNFTHMSRTEAFLHVPAHLSCSSNFTKSVSGRDNKLVHKQTNLSYKRVSRLCKSLGNNSNMVLNKIASPNFEIMFLCCASYKAIFCRPPRPLQRREFAC